MAALRLPLTSLLFSLLLFAVVAHEVNDSMATRSGSPAACREYAPRPENLARAR
jgi:hypothetical protein